MEALNAKALEIFPRDSWEYFNADEIINDESDTQARRNTRMYPVEYLNSLTPNGLPLSRLHIAVGCPIMVLRNIAPRQGLCNGSCLVVTRLSNKAIEARILFGDHRGSTVFIPRITMFADSGEVPFIFKRRQFPIRIAFAMTINKSQGQSLSLIHI